MSSGRRENRKRITQAKPAGKGPLRCLDKVRYRNQEWAQVAAKHIPGAVRAYRCHACGFWHVTSQKRRPRK